MTNSTQNYTGVKQYKITDTLGNYVVLEIDHSYVDNDHAMDVLRLYTNCWHYLALNQNDPILTFLRLAGSIAIAHLRNAAYMSLLNNQGLEAVGNIFNDDDNTFFAITPVEASIKTGYFEECSVITLVTDNKTIDMFKDVTND